MGGDNEYEDAIDLDQEDVCTGACCGCGCSCDQCFCRLNTAADNSGNQNHWPGEGGVPAMPINISVELMAAMRLADASFDEEVIGPNEAPRMHGVPFALSHANLSELTHSYSEAGSYQADWLARHRREVDENPAHHFLEQVVGVDSEMFDDEPMFNMELDGSMMVEDSVAEDSRSTITCSRSHSSRSASQILPENRATPGFVFRPLPLLEQVKEFTCLNCGCEHD